MEEFTLEDGRRLYLLGDGRLINLAAAEGHPMIVMDMSFANQALSAEYAVANAAELERKVYSVPAEIDAEIARLKLATMGIAIDTLTEEQERYLASWDEGHIDALVLAAGYATRLYPLTEAIAKPLLPVGSRPMIDWILDRIREWIRSSPSTSLLTPSSPAPSASGRRRTSSSRTTGRRRGRPAGR